MQKKSLFWLVAIAGLVLDQSSKFAVMHYFQQPGNSITLWPNVFNLTYVLNTGAAFSAFRGGANWLKWLSLGVSIGLMILAWKTPKMPRLEQFAYGCILAGALGNGIDRFWLGHVVDFLDFRLIHFPIFNIADTLINMGIIGLLISNFPLSRLPVAVNLGKRQNMLPNKQTRIFVYGTLKPGECNYPFYCERQVIHSQKVYTYGQLYALNLGYPAMTVGNEKVYGYLLIFAGDSVLVQLDRLETYDPKRSPNENEYERRLIPLYDLDDQVLESGWGYLMALEKIQTFDGVLIPSGWWSNPERSPMLPFS